jgi:DNA-binding MarR family transcriptional regulator
MFFLKELPTRETLEGYRKRFSDMNVDKVEAALVMLREASLLMRELDAYFAQHGLSQLRFLIMIVLDREVDRTRLMISEIADRLDVSRPVMTRTIRALIDDGLLEKCASEKDGRTRFVSLTGEGRNTLDRVLPGYYRLIDGFMKIP